MALVNLVVTQFETMIMSPKWWAVLKDEQKESVIRAMTAFYYPRHLRSLCDWGPFDQTQ
jgi:hypothetical protein